MGGPAIFISYRRKDSAAYARGIHERLSQQFGADRVFMDLVIPPGTDFAQAIESAIRDAGAFILVIGQNWLVDPATGGKRFDNTEDWVALEVTTAMEDQDLVIPVLVGGATMPHRDDLPGSVKPLATLEALEISDERWDYDLGRLVNRLQGTLDQGGMIDRLRRWLDRNRRAVLAAAAIVAMVAAGGGIAGLLLRGGSTPSSGPSNQPSGESPVATPSGTPIVLTVGSTGPEVRELETRLNELGFNVGTVDTEFTDQTGNAVVAFRTCWGTPRIARQSDGEVTTALDAIFDPVPDVHVWIGSDQDDDWTGSSGVDIAFGKDGSDTLDGAGGDDKICAGEGNDVVRGGAGSDRLYGGTGNDQLFGDGGDDTLLGFKGSDELDGGEGLDTCSIDGDDPSPTNCER